MFNFLIGVYLLSRHPVTVGLNLSFITPVIGALATGTYLSLHFGKVPSGQTRTKEFLEPESSFQQIGCLRNSIGFGNRFLEIAS